MEIIKPEFMTKEIARKNSILAVTEADAATIEKFEATKIYALLSALELIEASGGIVMTLDTVVSLGKESEFIKRGGTPEMTLGLVPSALLTLWKHADTNSITIIERLISGQRSLVADGLDVLLDANSAIWVNAVTSVKQGDPLNIRLEEVVTGIEVIVSLKKTDGSTFLDLPLSGTGSLNDPDRPDAGVTIRNIASFPTTSETRVIVKVSQSGVIKKSDYATKLSSDIDHSSEYLLKITS